MIRLHSQVKLHPVGQAYCCADIDVTTDSKVGLEFVVVPCVTDFVQIFQQLPFHVQLLYAAARYISKNHSSYDHQLLAADTLLRTLL